MKVSLSIKVFLMVAPLMLLLAAAPTLAVPDSESCCACVEREMAQTAGPVAPVLQTAFFCRTVTSLADQEAFGTKCDAVNGVGLCIKEIAMSAAQDNLDCVSMFAREGIACPAEKPVPAASQPLAVGLVAVLAAVGVWAARRRVRR